MNTNRFLSEHGDGWVECGEPYGYVGMAGVTRSETIVLRYRIVWTPEGAG